MSRFDVTYIVEFVILELNNIWFIHTQEIVGEHGEYWNATYDDFEHNYFLERCDFDEPHVGIHIYSINDKEERYGSN